MSEDKKDIDIAGPVINKDKAEKGSEFLKDTGIKEFTDPVSTKRDGKVKILSKPNIKIRNYAGNIPKEQARLLSDLKFDCLRFAEKFGTAIRIHQKGPNGTIYVADPIVMREYKSGDIIPQALDLLPEELQGLADMLGQAGYHSMNMQDRVKELSNDARKLREDVAELKSWKDSAVPCP